MADYLAEFVQETVQDKEGTYGPWTQYTKYNYLEFTPKKNI